VHLLPALVARRESDHCLAGGGPVLVARAAPQVATKAEASSAAVLCVLRAFPYRIM
jgi:hypothetical protein